LAQVISNSFFMSLFRTLYVFLGLLACGPSLIFGGPLRRLVVNGKPSVNEEFPFAVGLAISEIHRNDNVDEAVWRSSLELFCTGALIQDNVVVTAVHCLDQMSKKDFSVEGIFKLYVVVDAPHWKNLGKDDFRGSVHQVHSIVLHPEYKELRHVNDAGIKMVPAANDVALLLLSSNVPALTPMGAPRTYPKLPSVDPITLCSAVTQIGYGWSALPIVYDDRVINPDPVLRQKTGSVVPWETAISNIVSNVVDRDSVYDGPNSNFLVAADPDTGAQIAPGDSGGPALIKDSKGDWVLVGVNSQIGLGFGIVSALHSQKIFIAETLETLFEISIQMKVTQVLAKVFSTPWNLIKDKIPFAIEKPKLSSPFRFQREMGDRAIQMTLDNMLTTESEDIKDSLLKMAFNLPAPNGYNHSSIVEVKADMSQSLTREAFQTLLQRCHNLVAGFLDLSEDQRSNIALSPEVKRDLLACAMNTRIFKGLKPLVGPFSIRPLHPALSACPMGSFYEDAHLVGLPEVPGLFHLPQCPALPVAIA